MLAPLRDHSAQLLHRERRQGPNLPLPTNLRLLHRLDRVVPDPPPLDRSPQDALEKRKRPIDRRLPHSIGFQFGSEALDRLRGDRVESHRAESRQYMPIPKTGVATERASGEVWRGVELPPLLREVGEGLPAAAEQIQVAGSLPPDDLGIEGVGIPLAPDHFRARPALLVAPPHPPDSAAFPLDSFDAHRPRLAFSAFIEQGAQATLRAADAPPNSPQWRRTRPVRLFRDPSLQLGRMDAKSMAEPRGAQIAPRNRSVDRAPRQPANAGNVLRRQQPLNLDVILVAHFLCTPPVGKERQMHRVRLEIDVPARPPGGHKGGGRTAKAVPKSAAAPHGERAHSRHDPGGFPVCRAVGWWCWRAWRSHL